ncbi:hypothetical protein BCR33DRAFT_328676 [Rhizoclosmatium globosum]|uniref:Uncharacterized protein n=1 Tax=Rhizoclosmatium globosum TaxID=329046 RepID=A0A1Y2C4I1_9FUNG|nr:hypothetical protein BCR33DRAFT_328676 [Rhizoclosmatium globosum]|eukprot:ORY41942.1 hypothetical protein BCR33DRAFT_328676 [Rhizoclosmatium globosum]
MRVCECGIDGGQGKQRRGSKTTLQQKKKAPSPPTHLPPTSNTQLPEERQLLRKPVALARPATPAFSLVSPRKELARQHGEILHFANLEPAIARLWPKH